MCLAYPLLLVGVKLYWILSITLIIANATRNMRKTILYLSIALVSISVLSCKKKKLKEGNYIGNFYGYHLNEDGSQSEYEENELDVPISFSQLTDTSVIVNNYTIQPLRREGKDSIFGVIAGTGGGYYVPPTIKGDYRNLFGKITIEGTYTALTASGVGVSGTFEIKSD